MTKGLFDLSGQVALVTGSSRGLGLSISRGLAEADARDVLNGRDASRLAAAAAELARTGITAETAVFDVGDAAAVERAVADIENRLGPIGILVNNAGVTRRGSATETSDEAWREVMATNLDAVFWVARAVGRRMVERGAGKIVNISSMLGLAARAGGTPSYAASKAALHGLTRALCAEGASRGVQVNCIAPGAFETEMTRPLVESPEITEWVHRRTPAGRWGKPEDLVGNCQVVGLMDAFDGAARRLSCLRGHLDARLLPPDPECLGAGIAVLSSSHQVPPRTEVAIDHRVR